MTQLALRNAAAGLMKIKNGSIGRGGTMAPPNLNRLVGLFLLRTCSLVLKIHDESILICACCEINMQ